MLYKFTVSNFKNFNEKFIFDLSNTKKFEFNDKSIRNNIVNNALIYGPNGSGKSNLGFAIFDIISNISDKQKRLETYSNYLNADSISELAEFKYEFVFDNIIVKYSYGKKSLEDIIYEELYIDNDLVVYYDRRDEAVPRATINLSGADTLNSELSKIQISILKYIKNNTVLLDNRINTAFKKFFNFIDNMLHFRSLEDRFYQGYETGTHDIFEDIIANNNVQDFRDFLKQAEIECDLEIVSINNKKRLAFKFGNRTIDFWENSSTGTHSLSIFYYWLQKMKRPENGPSLVFIDEFDAFYHQSVSELIVRHLIGHNFQTILTTHNTSLMNNDLLRPDCNFNLNRNKINPFSSLTDKDLRKAHNIEKMYRAGSFDNE